MSGIESLTRQALDEIAAASSSDAIEALRVSLLGKSGSVTAQLKQLGALPAEERKSAGEAINKARDALTTALGERKHALDNAALDARLASETIDVTLPGLDGVRGGLHPVSRTMERMADIFGRLGFELADGPEIEDDWHNFEALNFPRTIRRGRCTTPSTSRPTAPASRACCAPTPRACKCATCWTTSRRCA